MTKNKQREVTKTKMTSKLNTNLKTKNVVTKVEPL